MKFKYMIEYKWKLFDENVHLHFDDKELAITRFNNLKRNLGNDLDYIRFYECKKQIIP
jgi:hypothetical protein